MLPALSTEKYAIVWVPSFEPSDGAGMTTLVPTVYVGLPSTLYSVTFTPEPASFPVRFTVTALACHPLGASSVVFGFVLSTSFVSAAEVVVLPAASVATTWSSTLPSATDVESKVEPVGCQVVPPLVEYSYATLAIPEAFAPPGSLVLELRPTAPRRYAPGSSSVALGAVLSTRRLATAAETPWLPATSYATVRKS